MAKQKNIDRALKELQRIFGEETVRVGFLPDSGNEEQHFILSFKMEPMVTAALLGTEKPRGISAEPQNACERLAGEIMEKLPLGQFHTSTNFNNGLIAIPVRMLAQTEDMKFFEKLSPLSFPSIQYLQLSTREFFDRHAANLRVLREKTGENWVFRRNRENEDNGFYLVDLPTSATKTPEAIITSIQLMGTKDNPDGVQIKTKRNGGERLWITADWFEASDLKKLRDQANFQRMIGILP